MVRKWPENNSWVEDKSSNEVLKTQKEIDNRLSKKEIKKEVKENSKKIKDELNFDKSVSRVWIDKKVVYKWKEYKVWFKWETTLVLWNKEYKLKLLATEHDDMQILQEIKFKWEKVEFTYQSWIFSSETLEMSDDMLWKILSGLINNNSYKKDIPWKDAILVASRL